MMDYAKKLLRFYRENKRMPSYSEIMELTGLRSKNSVFKLIERMREKGLVSKDDRGFLIPGRFFSDIPLLGTVEAGFPTAAEEELADTMTLDDYLIEHKEKTFLLRVNGDSMIDAGILPEDLVLVERGVTPKDGDIVIAEVDTGWTMKYFEKNGSCVRLVPGNKKYKPIIPQEQLSIAAVVKAVIRKY